MSKRILVVEDQPDNYSENRSATQRRFGDHLDQDARNAGWSDPSSTENSTGIISFVMTLPFRSFSTTTSCCAPSRRPGSPSFRQA